MVVGRAWVSIKVGLNVIIFKEHVIGASRLRLRLRLRSSSCFGAVVTSLGVVLLLLSRE